MELKTTMGISREVDAVYTPDSITDLISQIPKLKQDYSKISVVSTGNNWGYGCKAPSHQGGLLIQLHKCQQIKDFDDYHGIVTVEPGVSYGQLSKFLKEKGDQWLTPVHGGGPECSVLGNALERGYGLTPYTDHFGAVTSLKAILPSGEIFEGTLSSLGLSRLDKLYKYGLGPYYDGLFTQSGLGIVTEVTIKLAKKTDITEMFYFNIQNENDLELAVEAIKKSKQQLGSILSGVNLINRERALSMVVDYPEDLLQQRQPIKSDELKKISEKYFLTPWLAVGMIYGPAQIVKSARKQILQNFRSIKKRRFFFNNKNRSLFLLLKKLLTATGFQSLALGIDKLDMTFQVLNGIPNNIALQLAYWKMDHKDWKTSTRLHPSEDGCGLIWYAPLVEMAPDNVRKYVKFINEASAKFKFNALVTLTTIDDLCFDSTVPILFNKKDPLDCERAISFYNYLLNEGRKLGFFPYRLNIESQKDFDFQMGKFGLSALNTSRYGFGENVETP